MFGTVFAIVNTSACSCWPRAAASSALRTKPLSRDTTVPAAISALEVSTLLSVPGPAAAGSAGSAASGPSVRWSASLTR